MEREFFSLDPLVVAAIAAMAFATYATRISGYWLVRRTAVRGRLAGALEAVPGAVLTAIIAPMAFATGPAESLAAAATVLLALRPAADRIGGRRLPGGGCPCGCCWAKGRRPGGEEGGRQPLRLRARFCLCLSFSIPLELT